MKLELNNLKLYIIMIKLLHIDVHIINVQKVIENLHSLEII